MAFSSDKSLVPGVFIFAVADFSVFGGAISTISSRVTVPKAVYIVDGVMDVLTAPVGSGASVGVMLEASGDVVAVAAISGAPWSTTGLKDVVPDGTAAHVIKTSADKALSWVISVAALTAYKFNLMLRGYYDRG